MKNSIYIIVAIIGMMITTSCGVSRTAYGEKAKLMGDEVEVIELPSGEKYLYRNSILQADAQNQQMQQQQLQQQQMQVQGQVQGQNGSVSGNVSINTGVGQQQQQVQQPAMVPLAAGMYIYNMSPVTAKDYKCDGYGNPVFSSALKSKTNANLSATWVMMDMYGNQFPVGIFTGTGYIGFQCWMSGSGTSAALNSNNGPMKWYVTSVSNGRVQLTPQ